MRAQRWMAVTALGALLAGCGGGGGGSGTTTGGGTAAGGSTSTGGQTSAACSLRERQDWAAAQLREWYLFPETLPASLDPSGYTTVQAYIDALTATARSQGRDRGFTYLTSIAEENAFNNAGTSAGFGIRLSYDDAQRRVFVTEAFEGAPALAAGIDRGDEIVAIGTSPSDLRTVDSIYAASGSAGVSDAFGPTTAGTTRTLRLAGTGGSRDVTVTKASYALAPVSSRYGVRIIDDGGQRLGYVNLRTFIDPAEAPLRAAFQQFRDAGVTQVIVDLRYNGGGLVDVAETLGDLLGRNRATSEVFSFTTFRPEKSSRDSTRRFSPQPQSIAPMRLAFIATGATASASELVVNSFIPYLHANLALVGANSFGKPVGQIALDRAACDDRLRAVAFATQNASRQGNYFTGLASVVEASCRAADDVSRPLGDPREASIRAALDFLEGRACTAIAGTGQTSQALRTEPRPLAPAAPSAAQREVPGLF